MKIIALFNDIFDCSLIRIPRVTSNTHYECANFSVNLPLGIVNGYRKDTEHL